MREKGSRRIVGVGDAFGRVSKEKIPWAHAEAMRRGQKGAARVLTWQLQS